MNHDSQRSVALDAFQIRNLIGGFSDSVNRRDLAAFGDLWAEDGLWEIGDPLPARAEGKEAIVALVTRLLKGRDFFVQMTHEGVLSIDGDRATGRFTEEELGRSAGADKAFYHNYAVYEDDFVFTSAGWKFARRKYEYFYLDDSAIPGKAFPVITPKPLSTGSKG